MNALLLLAATSSASEELGTIEGVREAPDWSWSLALRSGAAVPLGGTSGAWGPGPQLGLSMERRQRPGLGLWFEAHGSSHRLVEPERLTAGDGSAPLGGSESQGAARIGLRWGAEGHPMLTPTFAMGIGAVLVHTRLEAPTADGRSALVQDLVWPSPRAEFAVAILVTEPISIRPSLGGSAFVGMDVGERAGDTVFVAWRAEAAIDLVVRI